MIIIKKNMIIIMFLQIIIMSLFSDVSLNENQRLISGYGTSSSLKKADKEALQDLISQISVQVESKFSDIMTEEDGNLSEFTQSIVNTYSNVTLNMAQRKVVEENGKVIVHRFIEKDKVMELFSNRKDKIIEFYKSGIQTEENLRIADALKYYYWSLVLLRSHPDHNKIKFATSNSDSVHLLYKIPEKIENIFANLQFEIVKNNFNEDEVSRKIELQIKYKEEKISNLDYHYWTGENWTNIVSAKDGIGFVEFFGNSSQALDKLKLKIEYVYENKSKIDLELKNVIEDTDIPFFREADIVASLSKIEKKEDEPKSKIQRSYKKLVKEIIQSLQKGNSTSAKSLFTDEGYSMYKKLFDYGNAKVIDEDPELTSINLNDKVMIRSLPVIFNFPKNDRSFVERVVFTFNHDKKVESLSFELSEQARKDILSKSERFGSVTEKYQLINFIENYKTAYSLERLDYISSIFDENALIIVGHILKDNTNIENRMKSIGHQVKYDKFTKKEYIERLSRIFRSNEFVNIQFENNSVKKIGGDDKIYGIQIAQSYYSQNYADKGYLFLMIDLNDSENPKIYVRTWQPKKNADGTVWGLRNFNF